MSELLDLLSDDTRLFIADVVTLDIERRDGEEVADELAGAKMIALAGIKVDLAAGGYDDRHRSAELVLDASLRAGLAERICQCPTEWHERHPNIGRGRWTCEGHYRVDLGEVDGHLLCFDCHDAVTAEASA